MATRAETVETIRRGRRKGGLREVRLLVPDLRDPKVAAKLDADLEALRGHPSNEEGDRFTDAALADMDDWRA